MKQISKAEPLISDKKEYAKLLQLYERTYMTAKLYFAGGRAYFGFRTYLTKTSDNEVIRITNESLEELKKVAEEMRRYPYPGPKGQYAWADDTDRAMRLHQTIKNRGHSIK